MPPLSLTLDDRFVDVLAQRVAALVIAEVGGSERQSPWMTAEEAAEHLRCPLSRIRKLTMTGELPHAKDGRRVLYERAQLDAYLRGD